MSAVRQSASTPTASRKSDSVQLRRKSAGFNLIELMTVVAVGAVLIGIGTSSYKYVTNSNRVSMEVNGLLGDLMVARSEAIRQSYNVYVCPTAGCASSSNWQSGWTVFADVNGNGTYDAGTDVLIRVQKAFSSTDTFSSDQSVQFIEYNSEGFAVGLPTTKGHITVTLHTTPTNDQWTRCVQVGTYGALTTERKGTGDCT
jgi:type IV fimbrial biogenesis protein FimT